MQIVNHAYKIYCRHRHCNYWSWIFVVIFLNNTQRKLCYVRSDLNCGRLVSKYV
jgi:hypothetical protein